MIQSIANDKPTISHQLGIDVVIKVMKYVIGIVLISLLMSIAIEWIGMLTKYWEQHGAKHSYDTFQNELRWTGYIKYWWDPLPIIHQTSTMISQVLLTDIYPIYDYLLAVYYVIQTTLIRIIVIVCSLPALLMVWLIALIDGLTSRDLRRYSVLHESSFIYHNAKSLLGTFIILPPLIYLSFPSNFHPILFLSFFVCPSGLIIWLMASRFKRYA